LGALEAQKAVVQTDAHRPDCNFRFLVEREGRRRVERHKILNQLHAAIGKTMAYVERHCRIGAVHLEAIGA